MATVKHIDLRLSPEEYEVLCLVLSDYDNSFTAEGISFSKELYYESLKEKISEINKRLTFASSHREHKDEDHR